MRGQNLVDMFNLWVARDPANTLHHLWLGAFSHQQSLNLIGQPDGGADQQQSNDDGSRPVIPGLPGQLPQQDVQKSHQEPQAADALPWL